MPADGSDCLIECIVAHRTITFVIGKSGICFEVSEVLIFRWQRRGAVGRHDEVSDEEVDFLAIGVLLIGLSRQEIAAALVQ